MLEVGKWAWSRFYSGELCAPEMKPPEAVLGTRESASPLEADLGTREPKEAFGSFIKN